MKALVLLLLLVFIATYFVLGLAVLEAVPW